jgi:Fe-S-cluster containining protein
VTIDILLLDPHDTGDLPAGEFSAWLADAAASQAAGRNAEVPCGDCNACCRGSYFIEVALTEADPLSVIDERLLFPAPGRSDTLVLGFDDRGRCPMLKDQACSIYDRRPVTCRTYDCRMFAATGISEPGPVRADVAARAARWCFSYADAASRQRHLDLVRGTRILAEADGPESDRLPRTATGLAQLAVRLHDLVIEIGAAGGITRLESGAGMLARALDDVTDPRA